MSPRSPRSQPRQEHDVERRPHTGRHRAAVSRAHVRRRADDQRWLDRGERSAVGRATARRVPAGDAASASASASAPTFGERRRADVPRRATSDRTQSARAASRRSAAFVERVVEDAFERAGIGDRVEVHRRAAVPAGHRRLGGLDARPHTPEPIASSATSDVTEQQMTDGRGGGDVTASPRTSRSSGGRVAHAPRLRLPRRIERRHRQRCEPALQRRQAALRERDVPRHADEVGGFRVVLERLAVQLGGPGQVIALLRETRDVARAPRQRVGAAAIAIAELRGFAMPGV